MRDLTPLEDLMRLEEKEELKSGAFVGSFFYIKLHLEDKTSISFCLIARWRTV